MNIAVLYREMAQSESALKQTLSEIAKTNGVTILPYNINALEVQGREEFINHFRAANPAKKSVRLLLHSIARGNLKPLTKSGSGDDNVLSTGDLQATAYAMSYSILDWAQTLLQEDLFYEDARIIGLTSEGAHRYWEGYAAVSVAKSSLESLCMYMAVEMAHHGLRTNVVQAGITPTPSLMKINGSDKLIEIATKRNPMGRATATSDVADVVYLLCKDEASWINGALIHADGGEHCR